eukprot:768756-Hanusia_phi.AAC.4
MKCGCAAITSALKRPCSAGRSRGAGEAGAAMRRTSVADSGGGRDRRLWTRDKPNSERMLLGSERAMTVDVH